MDLGNKNLEEWLKNVEPSMFPQGKIEDHYTHYKKLKEHLKPIHEEVVHGANLKDPEMFLNDHGEKHIETVISRASYLVATDDCNLTPYEVYLLLCCIQIHDIGNIFGRYNHEKNSVEIMKEARAICGRDTIEAMTIRSIAEAHGGKLENGNKDKISSLSKIVDTMYGDIRPRLLASILRFADELADDKTRASSTLLRTGKIPKKSEVFHAYAHCLQSVKFEHSDAQIKVTFSVPDIFLSRKFGKLDEEVFLMDEIYERLMKMYYEKRYCMRFMKKNIDIDRIRVHIQFYSEEEICEIHDKLVFDIRDRGYPSDTSSIYILCPELSRNNSKLDGEYFNSLSIKQNN